MSRQLNLLEISTRMLTIVKSKSFYRASFRNRPIVLIDDYDVTVHCGPFQKYHSRPIVMDGPDAIVRDAFIKRLESCPLDLDLTVEMRPARLNLSRYNPFNSARALIAIWWSTAHVIDARQSIARQIRHSSTRHVTCIVSEACGLVRHGKH